MADLIATEGKAKLIGLKGTPDTNRGLRYDKASSFGCNVRGTYAAN